MYHSSLRILLLVILCIQYATTQALTLNTRYGCYEITEPVITELIEHPAFQRLKEIRQYGSTYFTVAPLEYSRYEHSIGVFALLRRYNVPLVEQIAGLLHDVSHTVFSHVGDWLFGAGDTEHSYQDDHHETFLQTTGLADILAKHGYTVADIHHKKKQFTALEQSLPDLCADRIEYNITGGILEGIITESDATDILNALKFDDNRWYFTDSEQACKFAHCPLFMTEHVWSSPASLIDNITCAERLRAALTEHLVTLDEVLYGTDDALWSKIQQLPQQTAYRLTEQTEVPDMIISGKFRGVNPWIQLSDGSFKRLTELHAAYRRSYNRVHQILKSGYGLKKTIPLDTFA